MFYGFKYSYSILTFSLICITKINKYLINDGLVLQLVKPGGFIWYQKQIFSLFARYYEAELKSNDFFFSTGIIIETGTCILYQNEDGPLWITYLLHNIVTTPLNSNVPPLNENMYPSLVKFCWPFFAPLHHCNFPFLITGVMFAS